MNSEELQKTKDFIKRILYAEGEIAGIKNDIKLIKQEAKEEGILVKEINKAISELKREMKKSSNPSEDVIVNNYKDLIKEDADLFHSLSEIVGV